MEINSTAELQHYLPGIKKGRPRALQAQTERRSPSAPAPVENPLREFAGEISSSRFAPADTIREDIRRDPEKKRLYNAAVEFQAVFVNMMLKSMRSTLNRDQDMLYGGRSQEIFEDMLYDEYAQKLSSNTRLGLAETIYRQFSQRVPSAGATGNTPVDQQADAAPVSPAALLKAARAREAYQQHLLSAPRD